MNFKLTSFKTQLNDGNYIPIVGFGTNSIKTDAINFAVDCGYRHFDTAHLYQNEKEIGDSINEAIKCFKVKREQFYIVSKVWADFYIKGLVIKTAKQSVERLGLKYIDLLLLHFPISVDNDGKNTDFYPHQASGDKAVSEFDIIETYKELEQVRRMGLAKSIGVSNFDPKLIESVVREAEVIPVTNQVECHPYLNQENLLSFCAERKITLTAHSPLNAKDQRGLLENTTLKCIADRHVKTVAQVIIRWQTQREVIVIPRSNNRQHVSENLNVFDFTLSDSEMAAIYSLNRN